MAAPGGLHVAGLGGWIFRGIPRIYSREGEDVLGRVLVLPEVVQRLIEDLGGFRHVEPAVTPEGEDVVFASAGTDFQLQNIVAPDP